MQYESKNAMRIHPEYMYREVIKADCAILRINMVARKLIKSLYVLNIL